MKKIFILFLLSVIFNFFAAADTVLLCVSESQNKQELTSWEKQVLRAFEDGMLDVFFDSGHIVTNSFINECKRIAGDGAASENDSARILGNKLGADCVMIFEVFFPLDNSTEKAEIPLKTRYALYENSGKVLKSSSEQAINVDAERGEEELLDSFSVYGRNIASSVADLF